MYKLSVILFCFYLLSTQIYCGKIQYTDKCQKYNSKHKTELCKWGKNSGYFNQVTSTEIYPQDSKMYFPTEKNTNSSNKNTIETVTIENKNIFKTEPKCPEGFKLDQTGKCREEILNKFVKMKVKIFLFLCILCLGNVEGGLIFKKVEETVGKVGCKIHNIRMKIFHKNENTNDCAYGNQEENHGIKGKPELAFPDIKQNEIDDTHSPINNYNNKNTYIQENIPISSTSKYISTSEPQINEYQNKNNDIVENILNYSSTSTSTSTVTSTSTSTETYPEIDIRYEDDEQKSTNKSVPLPGGRRIIGVKDNCPEGQAFISGSCREEM
ncbi:unnamed protein product [Brassicogethes aeneus]|uniref:Uncharacterized protein n=1 Tax=Brassicogethes aeneus TaxID=1431903 RepID=A0A9P0BF50_BRAAE|nr:unnamed protein product [Brassicogethes aeneus]